LIFLLLIVLAFFDLGPSSHFWPFADVLREVAPAVTEKVETAGDYTDVTEGAI
jgi:hypothetical protein